MAPTLTNTTDFVARSASLKEVLQQVEMVRDSAVALLVTGEAGAGKERVARLIHSSGARAREPFVHVDCHGLTGELIGDVLFGGGQPGRIEAAGKGTLFIDGIDLLPLPQQERLLRVLENGTVRSSDGTRIVPVRARLVAATTTDLRSQVEQGTFRKDLFCRLNVFPIHVPPLRDRREDVAPLAQALLERHRAERTPPVHAIEERALAALRVHDWPGNVAELEGVVLDAILACGDDRVVRLENLPEALRSGAPRIAAAPVAGDPPPPFGESDVIVPLSELERRAIVHALKVTGGNVTRAARALGIGRATMYRKLERFKLTS